ncbi:MAG: T9SS C-terminal target domain-containing protein [Calditrichaeota bacterium]|nr:MAG: T9SS C-terminal target domain-containing protein [Calditrichota bacterium]
MYKSLLFICLISGVAYGSSINFSTFLGTSNNEFCYGIDVNNNEESILTGLTFSGNFPTTSGVFSQTKSGNSEVTFVTKFDSSASNLLFSTFIGGTVGYSIGKDLIITSLDEIIVTGETFSSDFPTNNPLYPNPGGNIDAFILKLNSTGSNLSFSTYFGGADDDAANAVSLDSSENILFSGYTKSNDFPAQNGFDTAHNGDYDIFLSKINSNGSSNIFTTFLGGADSEECFGISIDIANNILLTGYTKSSDFPIQNAYDNTKNGNFDVFLSKISSNGSTLEFSTYLGGTKLDIATDITLDKNGNVYLTGETRSSNFPVFNSNNSSYNGGTNDCFVTCFDLNTNNIIYSSFIGGSANDKGYSINVDESNYVHIIGITSSTDFPIVNAYEDTKNNGSDLFMLELNISTSNINNSTFLGGTLNEEQFSYGKQAVLKNNKFFIVAKSGNDFPITSGAFDDSYNGIEDIALFNYQIADIFAQNISTDGLFSFSDSDNETALNIDFSGITNSGEIEVTFFQNFSTEPNGVIENVSPFRWVISNSGLNFTSATLKIDINSLPNIGISNPDFITIYKRDNEGLGLFSSLPTTFNGSELIATVSSFSEFTLGINDLALPVQISNFNAFTNSNNVKLIWNTENEIDNLGFEVYSKTTVEKDYSKIASFKTHSELNGLGTSSQGQKYEFVDFNKDVNKTYIYKLADVSFSGLRKFHKEVYVSFETADDINLNRFSLEQNYPNPFNPNTNIKFFAKKEAEVSLKIFDIKGRIIKEIFNGISRIGSNAFTWDGTNQNNELVSSGIYFANLKSNGVSFSRKLVLMK